MTTDKTMGGHPTAPRFVTAREARTMPLDFDPKTGKPVNRAGRRRAAVQKRKTKGNA